MNILNVAYPFSPVSGSSTGGAEQIVWLIDEALVKKGHNSFIVSHKNSEILGTNYSPQYNNGNINSIKYRIYSDYLEIIKTVTSDYSIDVIHMHGIDFYEYLPKIDLPVLVTIHLPPEYYPGNAFEYRKNVFFNCVSETEQKKVNNIKNLVSYIPNGVRTDLFRLSGSKEDFCISLGRICWDKGYHIALEAAKKAGVPLYIGGEIYEFESHKKYYDKNILPWLDNNSYKFLGHLSISQKIKILSEAKCLLLPSLAEETSSLVAMEALASGTPVIGFNTGALPEIIEDSKTGYIVNDADEMAKAIKRIDSISPLTCRSEALKRFSAEDMTGKYISLYKQLISAEKVYA